MSFFKKPAGSAAVAEPPTPQVDSSKPDPTPEGVPRWGDTDDLYPDDDEVKVSASLEALAANFGITEDEPPHETAEPEPEPATQSSTSDADARIAALEARLAQASDPMAIATAVTTALQQQQRQEPKAPELPPAPEIENIEDLLTDGRNLKDALKSHAEWARDCAKREFQPALESLAFYERVAPTLLSAMETVAKQQARETLLAEGLEATDFETDYQTARNMLATNRDPAEFWKYAGDPTVVSHAVRTAYQQRTAGQPKPVKKPAAPPPTPSETSEGPRRQGRGKTRAILLAEKITGTKFDDADVERYHREQRAAGVGP